MMMSKSYRYQLLALLLCLMGAPESAFPQVTVVSQPAGDEARWEQVLCARFDALTADALFETSQLGLMVYDLTASKTLYARGARQLLRPASTMKLLTAITALQQLGGSHQFQTRLYALGEVADSVFTGTLYCQGGFDPAFGNEEMAVFIDSIRALGIHTLRGTIVADRSMKDADLLGEGWCWDDKNPVLSPLLCNRRDDFLYQLIGQLADVGILADVTTAESGVPESARLLCIVSHTIDQILLQMLKKSDNLYAEAVLYQVAAATGNRPATAKDAAAVEQELIRSLGLSPDNYRLADGSGLSLYNYLSAELEVELLKYAWHNRAIYDHLYPALPVSGIDGTLKDRMKSADTQGKVWAKTGTLSGISSLAGYAMTANGHVIAFAVINQGLRNGRAGRDFQDRLCQAICQPADLPN
ncbi:MAG: D-alanyl-D-alanine carboxypeptidase/D-alanyl-D-alanine-endopeptidase [Prevotella sp.]|nr:D-alanyl-D-alanine carboxypeptidase/D-alanyl-D-alanine-endopeptidase [Prevotella sp.]